MNRHTALLAALLAAASCRSSNTPTPQTTTHATDGNTASNTPPPDETPHAPVVHAEPPAPGPARDVHLPAIRRRRLPNGLELNAVEYHTLPVVHIRLAVRAGASHDPANLPGLASITGDMLKEGTRTKTSAQIAEAIEFVGGSLEVLTGPDTTTFSVSVLKDHADTALSLLAEVLTQSTFPQVELDKLKRRERDRLERSQNDPGWLSQRAFAQAVYGDRHPYGRFDTTAAALTAMTRANVMAFHRQRYLAGNMMLVVVGDLTPAQLDPIVNRTMGAVPRGVSPAPALPAPPQPTARQVVLVHRPGSAQSVIRIGNPSLRRRDDDYVPLTVANHILGGGASARLFMDLRELRSLTYGAYARLSSSVDVGTWGAAGQVRTPVTGDAMQAFFTHINCLTSSASPDAEMAQTRSYLVDSFALTVETPGNIADLIAGMRVYGLPDTWYDSYRTRVQQVDAAGAQAIAQRYIHPERASVVVVGDAEAQVEVGPPCAAAARLPQDATFAQQIQACAGAQEQGENAPRRETVALKELLRAWGPVRVVNLQGQLQEELAATPERTPPVRARCEELTAPALQAISHAEPRARAAAPPGR
ncbi:MAG: pitrilysin family protein [Polyangiales bacterium]